MGIFGNLFKPQPPSEEEAQKSVGVIDELRKRRGAETGKWLNLMQRDARNVPVAGPEPTIEGVDQRMVLDEAPYTPPVRAQYTTMSVRLDPALANQLLPKSEMVNWVNRLFGEFAVQSAAFNSSAQGTHLIVTVHAPEFEMEKPQEGVYSDEKKVGVFKGHLSTIQWGMLVQGYDDKIDIYMVPADRILDFMLHDVRKSAYTPYMTIDSHDVSSKKVWHIGGSDITFDTIPLLAKELLGDLVRVASGNLNESELFSSHEQDLKLGETVAQGFARPAFMQGAAQVDTGSSNVAALGTLDKLGTWTAASQFLAAMDRDVPWLTQQKADLLAAGNQVEADKLNRMITEMRRLSGQIGTMLADYHPTGSKYNAS